MSEEDGGKSQSRLRGPRHEPVGDPFRDPGDGLPPDSSWQRPRSRRTRRFENGVGAILLVDLLALFLVAASAPAAYLWLGQTHPSPIAVVTTPPPGRPTASAAATRSLAASGAASASASAASSPRLAYGDGSWAPAAPLSQGRWAAASVLLHDGRVMVIGGTTGNSSNNAVTTATIFDPTTGFWTSVTGMLQPRAYAMAVVLADGSVLVAGGSRNGQPLDTAERYYPETGVWVAAGRLNLPRTQGTLTLLPDGRILAAGGGVEGNPGWNSTASAEVFDPKSGAWTITAPMTVARSRHTATLLPDGRVLVAGGATTFHGDTGDVTATAEVYNPRTGKWTAAAPMPKPRYVHGAALLRDGRVLIAGGWYATSNTDPSHDTAEIYDPGADHWTPTGLMTAARAEYGLAVLPDGRVVAAGGIDPSYRVQTATELYDPATGLWNATGKLATATMGSAVQALPDGQVLIAGGAMDALASKVTGICEIYTPPAP
jgi:N-acetylneuraminic acid mutarotase